MKLVGIGLSFSIHEEHEAPVNDLSNISKALAGLFFDLLLHLQQCVYLGLERGGVLLNLDNQRLFVGTADSELLDPVN